MSPTKRGQVSGVPDPEKNPAPTSRLRFCSDSIAREGGRAEENVVAVADHFKAILRLLGEDPEREGLLDTPMRAAKAMLFFTKGYDDTIESAVKKVRPILEMKAIRLNHYYLSPPC
jgi:hypothetical protein